MAQNWELIQIVKIREKQFTVYSKISFLHAPTPKKQRTFLLKGETFTQRD